MTVIKQAFVMQNWIVEKIEASAKFFALCGGIMLILLSAMTIISVFGRTINAYGLGPIQGDFELVEHGTAFVVFCSFALLSDTFWPCGG